MKKVLNIIIVLMSLLFGQVAAFAAGSTTDKTKFPITPANSNSFETITPEGGVSW